MKLAIDNIFSPEGRKSLVEAYTKSMWADQSLRRESDPMAGAHWAGVPILQTPQDMVMIAELIWRLRPTLIVECGVWRGGGLLFYASLLKMIGSGSSIGIDINIDLARHVTQHPLGEAITLLQADSADPATAARINTGADTLVILDSNHSAAHVRSELINFSPLVKPGGYLIVLDGVMNILHDVPGGHASWKDDNPETAVAEFLTTHSEFGRDPACEKFGSTWGPGGYLKRIAAK